MPYWPPDSPPPPQGVAQMPQAGAGPAPVPYSGPDERPEPPLYGVPAISAGTPGPEVMSTVPGASPLAAPNVNPYEPGATSPVMFPADADAGGRDPVSGTVAAAVTAAEARLTEMQGDTFGLGSHIGDLMNFGPSPLDPGAGPGLTDPAGHYYDPPRAYGDEPQ